GREVAEWATLLCKDKRRPDDDREEEYMARLARAPWQGKVCKLADVFDNLIDSKHLKPEQRERTKHRARRYPDARGTALPREARPAYEIVERLFAEMNPARF